MRSFLRRNAWRKEVGDFRRERTQVRDRLKSHNDAASTEKAVFDGDLGQYAGQHTLKGIPQADHTNKNSSL